MMPRPHPETMKMIATKAQRHKGILFFLNFGALVAMFMIGNKKFKL